MIERAVLLSDGPELVVGPLGASDETATAVAAGPSHLAPPSPHEAQDAERARITQALERTRFRISGPHGAALLLGMHPNTLRYRMQRLGITNRRG